MRLLTRGRVITLGLVGAFLAINVVALRWSTNFFSGKAQPATLLKYGDHVPQFATNNPINLVLYFSLSQAPGYSTELVKYAETLSQRYRFPPDAGGPRGPVTSTWSGKGPSRSRARSVSPRPPTMLVIQAIFSTGRIACVSFTNSSI